MAPLVFTAHVCIPLMCFSVTYVYCYCIIQYWTMMHVMCLIMFVDIFGTLAWKEPPICWSAYGPVVGYYLIPLVCILSCRKSSPRPKTAMRHLMNQFLVATIKHSGDCRTFTNYVCITSCMDLVLCVCSLFQLSPFIILCVAQLYMYKL